MPQNVPLLPPWIALPAAGLVMLFIAGHVLAQHRADVPPSRRRIRVASGVLMMITAGLLGYGFGVVTPAQPGMFALTWMAILGLLVIIVGVAAMDVVNNLRLHAHARRELRRAMARPLAERKGVRSGDEQP